MTTPKMTSVSCPIEISPLFHHNIRTSAEHNNGVHEILASASFLRHSSAGVASVIGDDGGDVIASIVSRSHVDDSGYSNSSRSAIVRRMDGSLVASFDLPPASPASHQDIRIHPEGSCDDKYKHDGDDNIQHDKVDDFNYDGTQWRTYQDPILCWASFRANNHRFDDFDDNSSGQNNETEAYSRNMLCILANPTTLMIFDALGENECTFQDDGDVRTSNKMGEGGGPAGHTIPLPFRARAIYSAGKGLGLLISRVDVPEDYYVGDGDMNEFDDVLSDDYNFLGDDGSGGGGFENAENELETTKVPGRGVNEDDDDDVGGGSEDFPLQDPPSPVRLASPTTTAADVNKRNMLHVDTGGWDAKARHAVNSTSHKMNAIYPMQNAIENMNNINALPCLFSLRHPLDEIRPLAIDSSLYSNNNKNEARTESRSQGRGEKVTIATNANHYFDARTTDMDKSLFVQPLPNQSLFSNVQERLVYVSTPRLFHTHSVHRHSCTNPICVTYNEYLQRHAVWTLVRAVPPVEELPLWKTTGRGAWRNYGVDDTEAAVGNGDINGSVENGREKEDEPSNNEESTLGWNDKYLKRVKELSRETDESRQSVGDGVNFGGEEGGMGRGPSIAEYEHDYEHGVGAEAGPPVRSLFQQPHDPFLDIQMQQQKLAQVGMARAPSSFSDIHPDYCLKLLFVEEQDNENIDDDPVKDVHFSFASKRQVFQRQMFLATDMHGQGDLVLSIFMPNRRAVSEENLPLEPAIIRCFNLNLPIDISSAKGRVNIESVIRSVDLPCSSAQPIMSIPAPLALFSCDGKGTSTCRFQTSDVNIMAYDILVIQRSFDDTGKDDNTREDTRSPNLSLYRAGTIHVADFCLPKGVYSGEHYEIFDLKNAVGGRVDIVSSICKSPPFEESSCVTSDLVLRASFSLVMHSSPISETSLRAIESSLVGRTDTVSASADSFLNRKDARIQLFPSTLIGLILPLLLRSDCAMMTQQMWVDDSGQDHRNVSRSTVDDHCWCALVSILLRLLLGPLNDCHDEPTESNDSIQDCQRKVVSSPRSAWEELLQSEFHLSFMQGEGQMLFGETKLEELQSEREQRSGSDTIDSRRRFLRSPKIVQILSPSSKDETYIIDTINRSRKLIFDTLHLLHEDCRLAQQSRGLLWTRCLGSLLLLISEHMSPSMVDFEDHYQLHLDGYRCSFEEIRFVSNFEAKSQRLSNFTIPPCIMTCLDNFLQLGNGDFSSDDFICGITAYDEVAKIGLNGACSYSWMMLRLFKCLFDKDNIMSNITHPEEDEKSAECLDGDSESLQRKRDREGVLALLEEGIYHPIKLQDELPIGAFLPIFEAVCRCRQDPPQIVTSINSWSPAAYDLIGRNDLAELLSLRLLPIEQRPNPTSSSSGYSKIDELITSTDDDKDGLLALEEFSATIFPDDNRVREAARLLRSSRPIFLRVPRPVELSDHDYERKKQEKLSVLCHRSISLCLGRGMLTMGTHHALSAEQLVIPEIVLAGRVPPANGTLALDTSSYPPNFRVWPEFHNGVAAGLRLSSAMGAKNHERTITRTWIKYNKPVTPQQSDNAAGNNSSSQIPPNYAHGGFLMALGLRGHLSVLTATDLTDYLTQGTITTTVGIFLGMAANKRGSCDPATSKMLCLHIPSLLPSSFIPMELASTVQASAVAGIGLLYQGSSHRLMTEFLLNEIGKHPIKDQSNNDREGFSLLCGLSLGMVNLQKGTSTVCGLEDLRIEERLHKYISGGIEINDNRRQKGVTNAAISAIHESERNSRVYEANAINRDITAPGATVALGLIYIKSHNKSVAMSLGLPDTHFQLDYVRPDLLALRVISRSLIFWNEIEPTPEWIDSIVPKVVTSSMEFMKNAARRAASFGQMDEHDQNSPEIYSGQGDATDFDPQAVRQAKSFIVAGACFSLGLRYAGTANRAAGSAIFERIIWFLELRDNKDIVTLTQRPDTCTLTTCLCTAAISLAMVMAGTGDLDSFRLFRAIRWRCDENTLYGTHMTLGAAIGLLFLGGGKYTLGNSPDDIAMLITSFYPHYPVLSSDNQYHLQALRHLYALAVHKRILEAVDVDSAEKVCIPIELSLAKSNESIEVTTPYLLANDSDFTEIRLKSDRYYPVVINLADFNVQGNLSTLYVKRKSGHLDHLQDPNALSSLSTTVESIGGEAFLKSIKFFSNDTILSSFAKYFCNPQYKIDDASFEADVTFEKLCNDIVNECMNDEKTAILPLYLKLFRFIDGISKKKNLNIQNIWDARLLRSYVEMKGRMDDSYFGLVNLLSREFIALVCESIEKSFRELGVDESALIKFFNDDGMKRTEGTTPRRIVESFLVWCQ